MEKNLKNIRLLHFLDKDDNIIILDNSRIKDIDGVKYYRFDESEINDIAHLIFERINKGESIKFPINRYSYIEIKDWKPIDYINLISNKGLTSDTSEKYLLDILVSAVYNYINQDKEFRKKILDEAKILKSPVNSSIFNIAREELASLGSKAAFHTMQNNIFVNYIPSKPLFQTDLDINYVRDLLLFLTDNGQDLGYTNTEKMFNLFQYLITEDIDNDTLLRKYYSLLDSKRTLTIFKDFEFVKKISDDKLNKIVSKLNYNDSLTLLEYFNRDISKTESIDSSKLFNVFIELHNIFSVWPKYYEKAMKKIVNNIFMSENFALEQFFKMIGMLNESFKNEDTSDVYMLETLLDGNIDSFNRSEHSNPVSLEYIIEYYRSKHFIVPNILNQLFSDRDIKTFASAYFTSHSAKILIGIMSFFNDKTVYSDNLLREIFSNMFRALNQCTTAEKRKAIAMISSVIYMKTDENDNYVIPNNKVDVFLSELNNSFLRNITIEKMFEIPGIDSKNWWALNRYISSEKVLGLLPEEILAKIDNYRYKGVVYSSILRSKLEN